MRFDCRMVDAAFLDNAPLRFVESVDLPLPPSRAFAILEDSETWPQWFRGMKRVTWTSALPFGVGTTRTVELESVTVEEHFFRWEQDRRFSFCITTHNRPLWHALAEDYLLTESAEGHTRFTYTMALDPRLLLRVAPGITCKQFGGMVQHACAGLQEWTRKARAPTEEPGPSVVSPR